MTDFEEAVAALGHELGLELQVLDGTAAFDATVDVEAGAAMRVELAFLPETQWVLVSAQVGELPREGGETLCRMLLEANHLFVGTGGATFSLEPESRQIRLEYSCPLDMLENADGAALMEYFLNIAENWRKRIAAPDDDAAGEMPQSPFLMASAHAAQDGGGPAGLWVLR